jgi:ABC-type uncharacterized transport system substrate-binding protein
MPAIYAQSQYVNEGGLMSYGAPGVARQVAIRYVARILKGAKPADCRSSSQPISALLST